MKFLTPSAAIFKRNFYKLYPYVTCNEINEFHTEIKYRPNFNNANNDNRITKFNPICTIENNIHQFQYFWK